MIYSSSAAQSKAGKEHCIPNPVPQMDKSRDSSLDLRALPLPLTAGARTDLRRDARVAALGDSLRHDVLGAARIGVFSILCCSGVHSTELQLGVPQARAAPAVPPTNPSDSKRFLIS